MSKEKATPETAEKGALETALKGPTLRLHGVPRIDAADGSRPLERKTAGLVSYLALRGETSRSSLATLLWPDASPQGARNNLRQALFRLKKAANADVVVGGEALSIRPGLRVDLGEPSRGETLLAGCNYADCPEFQQWLEGERARLSGDDAAALAARADGLERDGDFEGALRAAESALRSAPLDESHHRRVMRLHYYRGDTSNALAAYAQCRRLLREELDASPDADTQALAAAIEEERAKRRVVAPAVPPTLIRPPRLVGRDREIARMACAWEARQAFVLVGEAGLGKSRLLAQFAEGRGRLAMVSSRPGDGTIPYSSLARLLRAILEQDPPLVEEGHRAELSRLMPELHGVPPPGEMRPRLVEAAVRALLLRAAASGWRALLVDDLHFADAASLEMLAALALEETGLVWGFAQRPADGAPEGRALREALTEAWRGESIVLRPFDEAQMGEFVESLRLPGVVAAHLVPALLKTTGGNPLFVLETLKSALAGGRPPGDPMPRPANVGALIERRLAQLSPRALALARAAAVAGVDFDAEVAGAILDEKPMALADAWRELEDAHVLVDAAFAHDLIYEATARTLPAPLARHAHAVVAACLERRAGAPERIAEHWIGAGDLPRALPFMKSAAVKAEAAARYVEAREWLERAIELTSAAGDTAESLELRFLLIELLKEIGDLAQIAAVVAKARDDAATADDLLRLARAEAQALASTGEAARGIEVARAALEDVELLAGANPLRVAELQYVLADSLLAQFEGARALAILQPLEPVFRSHPDLQWRGWYYSDLMRALYTTDHVKEGESVLPIALDIARRVGRKRMISGVLLFAANAAAAAGRIHEPVEHIREAQLLIAEKDDSTLGRIFHILQGDFLTRAGRYREAFEAMDSASTSSVKLGDVWIGRLNEVNALALAQVGQLHAAREALALPDPPTTPAFRRARFIHRIEAMHLAGQPVAEALAEYEALCDANTSESARWRGRIAAAMAGREDGDFEAIASAAESLGLMGHALGARVCAARAAARRGEGPAVRQNTRVALDLLKRFTLAAAYRPGFWLALHEAALEHDAALAMEALHAGAAWVRTVARYHLPDSYRDSFLQANRVNRVLLEAERAFGSRK